MSARRRPSSRWFGQSCSSRSLTRIRTISSCCAPIAGRGARQATLTGQEFLALRERTDVFAALATIIGVDANLTGVDDMEALPAASISDDFFHVLGVVPFAGRRLSLREDMGRERVSGIAISYELWQRRWRGDPSLVGQQIEVNNFHATVVAIMPKGFEIYLGPGIAGSSSHRRVLPVRHQRNRADQP